MKINLTNILQVKDLQSKFNYTINDFYAYAYIGNDEKIYLIFSDRGSQPVFTDNKVICLTVEWKNHGEIKNIEVLDFSKSFENIWIIQPLGDRFLIEGKCKENRENNKYLFITDINGNILKALYLGWLDRTTILVDSKNRIVIGYYDEIIFDGSGKFRKGLIIWDENGNKLWENTGYDIVSCYSLNIDGEDNIWFVPDNNLINIDFSNGNAKYNIYDTGKKLGDIFPSGLLLGTDLSYIIIDSGYFNKKEFVVKYKSGLEYKGNEACEFLYSDKNINFTDFSFRNTKALLWNKEIITWFDLKEQK